MRRALIVDDEPASRLEFEAALRLMGFETVSARDLREAEARLGELGEPAVVLVVARPRRGDGAAFCSRAREAGHYVIALCRPGTDDFTRALASGADECLTRPVVGAELEFRVRTAWRTLELRAEVVQRSARDSLTGLWTHATVLEMLQAELARAARDGRPVSVLLADVDRLHEINERHGHAVGDEILRAIAQRIRIGLRAYDMVGRYGGEEFMAVLPHCGKANALEVTERVRRAVSGTPIATSAGEFTLTLSCGLATTTRDIIPSVKRCLQAVEEAVVFAKKLGRNRVEVAADIRLR
ncbi:MAG TPA: diguanylate cyclase [Gammaproteobacteria bacterium]|nr:diguanylate cyclase [Gammaproteobacteria bacterium]